MNAINLFEMHFFLIGQIKLNCIFFFFPAEMIDK